MAGVAKSHRPVRPPTLRREFSRNERFFPPRNLKYMRRFAEQWPDDSIVQAALAQIPWYHNIALLEKLDSSELRLWYAAKNRRKTAGHAMSWCCKSSPVCTNG